MLVSSSGSVTSHFVINVKYPTTLHSQKPDNVGFDGKGNVKIYDLGLAKELKDKDRTEDGLYKLTGFTGSIRYMAPEVGLKQAYNQKADICKCSQTQLLTFSV